MTKGHNVAGERLRSFVERVERLNEERDNLGADIREVYSELKGVGFDAKVVRKLVALRKIDPADRREEEELLDLYKRSLGMEGTPLDAHAKEKEGTPG